MDSAERERLEAAIRAHCEADRIPDAATCAIEGFGPEVFGYLVAAMMDETAANEVFSQFCEDLWRGAADFRWESSFRTWAYRLARNARHRYDRDAFRRRGRPLHTGQVERLAAEVRDRTLPYVRTTIKQRFSKLRQELDPDDQALLLFRLDRQMSWQDVALAMEARGTPATVAALKMRLQRLKQRLERLAQEAGLLEDAPPEAW